MSLTIGGLDEPIRVIEDKEYWQLQGVVADLEDLVGTIDESLSEYLTGSVNWEAIQNVPNSSETMPGIAKLSSSGDSRTDIATLKYVSSKSGANGVPTSRKVNGYPLTSDVNLTSLDVNSMSEKEVDDYLSEEASKHSLVPTSRRVQGVPLSSDVTITPDMFGEEITKEAASRSLVWANNGTTIEPLRVNDFRLYGKKFVNGALTYTREDIGVPGPEQFYNDEMALYEYAKKVEDTDSRVGLMVNYMFVGSTVSQRLDYRNEPETAISLSANDFHSGLYHEEGGDDYGRNLNYVVKARLGPEVFVPADTALANSSTDPFIRLITKLDNQGNRYYRAIQFCMDIDGEDVWQ